jgi:aconitase A
MRPTAARFGDSASTGHVGPAGSIKPAAQAGCPLAQDVAFGDCKSYGSLRRKIAKRSGQRVSRRGILSPGLCAPAHGAIGATPVVWSRAGRQ